VIPILAPISTLFLFALTPICRLRIVCEQVVGFLGFLPKSRPLSRFVGRTSLITGFCSQARSAVEHRWVQRGTGFVRVVHMMNMKKEPALFISSSSRL